MKMKLQILFFLLFVFSLSVYSQWQKVSYNFPDLIHTGYAIDAVQNCALVSINYSSSTGVYPDTFSVFKTTNDGNSWTEIVPPFYGQSEIAVDISITDQFKYWLATDKGRILATTDGGVIWTVQFENNQLTNFMNYVEIFNTNEGIAMGDGLNNTALILHTSYGGLNWVSVNDSAFGGISYDTWRMIDFAGPTDGYFCAFKTTTQSSRLYKTTSFCSNWEDIYSGNSIAVLKFFDTNHGLFLTKTGSGMKTLDGGITWESISFNFEGWGTDIEFVGDSYQNVWVITQHKMYFSSDFGDTWTNYPFNEDIRLYDIHFIDLNTGWLLTNDGVYFTNNNANVTKLDEKNKVITNYKLFQNYPNPFNPTTIISYQVPVTSNVEILVFNTLGEKVATLVNGEKEAGVYDVVLNEANLPSGVYLYKLTAGDFISTKKMILLK